MKKVVGLQSSVFYNLSGVNVLIQDDIITLEIQRWHFFIPFSPLAGARLMLHSRSSPLPHL